MNNQEAGAIESASSVAAGHHVFHTPEVPVVRAPAVTKPIIN